MPPDDSEAEALAAVATVLRQARRVTVLTGAGISAESGLDTFRDPDGIWSHVRPEEIATPEAFQRDPSRVWAWYAARRRSMADAKPNAAHRALADLQTRVSELVLVTQNIDGLHAAAGSDGVIELHGNIRRSICARCGRGLELDSPEVETDGRLARNNDSRTVETEARTVQPVARSAEARGEDLSAAGRRRGTDDAVVPRCRACGGLARPDVVWFGETLPRDALEAAWSAAERCDMFFSIGTSAVVEPAASLPRVAKRHGAVLVEVNPETTPVSYIADHALRQPAGEVLPAVLAAAWTDR